MTKLIYSLIDDLTLFTNENGKVYVDVKIEGIRQTYSLDSPSFEEYVTDQYFSRFEDVPSEKEVKDFKRYATTIAKREKNRYPVFFRTAKYQDEYYIDLGDDSWEAIKVSPHNLAIIRNPPVRFRRTDEYRSLPRPDFQGCLEDLKPFLNIGTDDDRFLVLTFILYALTFNPAYPILIVTGPAGASKSTVGKILKALLDPSETNGENLPSNERSLAIKANQRGVLNIENVSDITSDMSDVLCKLATGYTFTSRTLYSDTGETVLKLCKPVILSAITSVVSRADLADRSIVISLPAINDLQRITEDEFYRSFEQAKPRIFGALLKALHETLKVLSTFQPERLPRMADYGRFAQAVEKALEFEEGTFWRAYESNRAILTEAILDQSNLPTQLRKLLEKESSWQGTSSQLLDKLNSQSLHTPKDKNWPKSPGSLTNQLKRLETDLEKVGIQYTRLPRQSYGTPILLEYVPIEVSQPTQPSSNDFSDDSDGGDSSFSIPLFDGDLCSPSSEGIEDETTVDPFAEDFLF